MFHEIKAIFRLIKICKRTMYAITSAYKLLQNENFRTIYCGWLKFRGVPIFVVSVEGPIHEFQFTRNGYTMTTHSEPNECVISVQSTKIGTHENKAIYSNSLQQKIWSFKSYQKPLIESLLSLLINRIKKIGPPVKLRENMLNFVVKYCENCIFFRAQVIPREKRRIFHDVIVHFYSLRGKGDEARRYHDVKTMS